MLKIITQKQHKNSPARSDSFDSRSALVCEIFAGKMEQSNPNISGCSLQACANCCAISLARSLSKQWHSVPLFWSAWHRHLGSLSSISSAPHSCWKSALVNRWEANFKILIVSEARRRDETGPINEWQLER